MHCFPLLRPVAAFVRSVIALAVLALSAALAQAGETTNSVGITMVDVPAGSFVMGSCTRIELTSAEVLENIWRTLTGRARIKPEGQDCLAGAQDKDAAMTELPQHRVSVRSFQMGKTEVTLGQFKQFISSEGRKDLLNDKFLKYNRYGDNAPVAMVSWHDAQAFIAWLNKVDGGGYRLPSEAEWEYACRAGERSPYCGGHLLHRLGWHIDISDERPHDVAGKNPNSFGLYDMSGNVYEWVQDCWHDSYRGAPADGSAWELACKADGRGLRGGSWGDSAKINRVADRRFDSPAMRSYYYGFRLARTPQVVP